MISTRVFAVLSFALLAFGCADQGREVAGPGPDPGALAPFRSAATCGGCHPQHLAEWETSMHAYASSDPLMLRMAEIAAAEPGGAIGETCFDCHAPAAVRQQLWLAGQPEDPLIEDLSEDGVSCDVCHSIDIVPPIADISFLRDVDPTGPKLAGLRNPVVNDFHESLHDNSFVTSVTCAPCHQVNFENDEGLENTYTEWQDANLSGMGRECQFCHMPTYTGTAATGGPLRQDLHRHGFVGVDYAHTPFRGIDLNAQKDAIRQLLRGAVQVDTLGVPSSVAPGDSFTFSVEVTNHNSGHSIPSGTSFSREMWIDVRVRDAGVGLLYESGYLEANDDLVSPVDDPALAFFGATMLDASNAPTFFTWRAVSIDESKLLPFGESRTASYTVDVPALATGPITIDLVLRFRPLNPKMVREVGVTEILPIEIFDMWEESHEVAVSSLRLD